MNFKDSKTFQNLKSAFAGESQAYMAYTFYANQADEEGLAPLSILLNETASNEFEHAEAFFKRVNSGGTPNGIGEMPNAIEGLKRAILAERYEAIEKYEDAAKVAKEEGYDKIAELFDKVRHIEETHMNHFESMLKELDTDTLYHSEKVIAWVCTKCGNVEYGETPPDKCPVCNHDGTYYRKLEEKYPENY